MHSERPAPSQHPAAYVAPPLPTFPPPAPQYYPPQASAGWQAPEPYLQQGGFVTGYPPFPSPVAPAHAAVGGMQAPVPAFHFSSMPLQACAPPPNRVPFMVGVPMGWEERQLPSQHAVPWAPAYGNAFSFRAGLEHHHHGSGHGAPSVSPSSSHGAFLGGPGRHAGGSYPPEAYLQPPLFTWSPAQGYPAAHPAQQAQQQQQLPQEEVEKETRRQEKEDKRRQKKEKKREKKEKKRQKKEGKRQKEQEGEVEHHEREQRVQEQPEEPRQQPPQEEHG